MYRKMEDFLKDYESLINNTTKMFEKLTDQNINQAIIDGHRTLGQIAWHIVTTIPEMMNRTGLAVSSIEHEAPPPNTAVEIINGYKTVAEQLNSELKSKWNDQTLEQMDDMYGQQWPRMMTLKILIHHEIHHRGQMTILLRQANQSVPGVVGPSKEEWSQWGMEPPAY